MSREAVLQLNLQEPVFCQVERPDSTRIGDYVKVYTSDKVLITSETLKNIEDQLPASRFIRIHKSFIVSLESIKYLEGNQLRVGEEMLPVGLTFKERVLEELGR